MEGALAGRRRARATVLAVGLASGSLLLLLVLLTIRTWQGPDIFYHLFLGRRILDGGGFQPADDLLVRQPQYVNLYWLFQVIAELLHRAGGVTAASLLFTAVWTAVCALWARAAGCLRRPAIGLPLALGAILILGSRFEPRPEAFSYLWLILQLGWLSAWDPTARTPVRFYVLFAASQALWANMHGYFVLGPLLVAARLAGAWLRREERRAWRRPALLLVLALAASCLSPFGWRTWAFAHTLAAFLRSVGGAITEFGPPTGAFLRVW
ncbi:MAG: hypothetical protein FJY75_07820, partial [Candidatus Eisenbacteria bacterium]|nr:hypothetical protein [Candidatus Eisenbacteria bacterium]